MGISRVSIIVPLYNYQTYIVDCIRSIQNQDYPNYELIVVDDCSTDNSFSVAKSFENHRVKVIRLPQNLGYSKAKNEGIIMSQGSLIACLDADDMLTRNSISCRVNAISKHNVSFVHANAITVGGKITLRECYEFKKKKRQHPRIHAQTVMMKREVYQKFGLYDESLRSRSDKEMWWRLFGKNDDCQFKIQKKHVDEDVAYYRHHGKSMMAKRRKNLGLQKTLRRKLERAYQMRQNGITENNTKFLRW